MPIDTSIYQNLKPIEMPSMLDSQAKAMNLTQLAMQNQRMAKQAEVEDRDNALKAYHQKVSVVGDALESMSGMKPEERATYYPQVRAKLIQSGVLRAEDAPEQYDDGFYRTSLFQSRQTKDYIDNQLKKAHTAYYLAEAEKNKAEAGTKGKELTAADRLAKMGGEVKQKVGFLTGGMQALTRYEDSFRGGGRQEYVTPETPILGKFKDSTPIDESRISMEEAIGRLASGGAINKDEEARFRRMIPTAADSDETAARKLVNLRKEMEGKLTAYGFKTQELGDIGYNPADLGYGTKYAQMENRGLFSGKKEKAPAQLPGEQSAYAGTQPPSEMVKVRAPNGSIYRVPRSQVGAAIANGGDLVK